ncbi:MAG: response regulator, partial [Lachnoclostridium sp.]|nr:response regulator [Lachnoclostridium sp.]
YFEDAVLEEEVIKSLKSFQYPTSRANQKFHTTRIPISNARILVVDDNITNLEVIKGLMKPYEMQIDCVTNGPDAIHAIREEEKKYNAIFMDHIMPDMDGIEATRIIRKDIGTAYAQTIPIIALTANAAAGMEEMFLENGFQAYISKPINLKKLDSVLNRLVRDKKEDEEDSLIIEGIHTEEGIHYSGSKELFIRLLGSFYRLIDLKADKLEKCLHDKKIKEITIEAHALKSTARFIGAKKLSEDFALLEEYGMEEDLEALEKKMPDVLEHYRSYKPILKPYGELSEKNKKKIPEKKLVMLLKKIVKAMNHFDLDRADEVLKELEECQIPQECRLQMETLKASIADVAMEESIKTAEVMIEILEEM